MSTVPLVREGGGEVVKMKRETEAPPKPPTDSRFVIMSVRDVCDMLNISTFTLRKMMRDGTFAPAFKAGRAWRFRFSDVESWMRAGGSGGPQWKAKSPATASS